MKYYKVHTRTHYGLVEAASIVTALTRGARLLGKRIMAHDKGYGSIHASEIDRDEYERELAAINSIKEVESATE